MKRSCLMNWKKLNWKNFGIYGGGWTKKEISCLGKWLPFWEGEGDCRGRVANPHGFGVPKREKWGKKKVFSNGQNERRSFTFSSVKSLPTSLSQERSCPCSQQRTWEIVVVQISLVFVGVFLCFVFCVCKFNYFQQKPKIKTRGEEKRREDVDVRCKKT